MSYPNKKTATNLAEHIDSQTNQYVQMSTHTDVDAYHSQYLDESAVRATFGWIITSIIPNGIQSNFDM